MSISEKHLKPTDTQDELSSSDDETPYEEHDFNGIFEPYEKVGGDFSLLHPTRNILEKTVSAQSVFCIICIRSIKRADAIWSCSHCFCLFHLVCIQKWARDSVHHRTDEIQGPISVFEPRKVEWNCPKCKHPYIKEQIPDKYLCFCTNTVDPPFDPKGIPHTCRQICGKRLSLLDNCKHTCVLPCHPGPCPPCPEAVNTSCFCKKGRKKRVHCISPTWSCGQQCERPLMCHAHYCENVCHEGNCPPCTVKEQPCQCGALKTKRPCNDLQWQCEKVCDKTLSCGYHNCKRVCHAGGCGPCPNAGMQSCPCGSNQRFVQCPDAMETCLGTCGRRHEDCEHNCTETCHKGPCPVCQVLVEKKCQCSAQLSILPCSDFYKCNVDCGHKNSCGKHICKLEHGYGSCPPCKEICGQPLRCGHSCTMTCHYGPCHPCPIESNVACRCRENVILVPCGRAENSKPPKCAVLCKTNYKCGHGKENRHACHSGDCPPCTAISCKQNINQYDMDMICD